MTFQVIRSCKACAVDVSVPQDEDEPRCPRCGGELGWPTNPQGDSNEKTLLEGRPGLLNADSHTKPRTPGSTMGPTGTLPQGVVESHLEATVREPPPSGSGSAHPSATNAAGSHVAPPPAESDEHSGLADTATFPGQVVVGTGRRLGAYELRGVLGKGGMGVVYEAFHTDLERIVALKVMSVRDDSGGEEEYLRFKREARAAAKLQHPNIVPILEVGEANGQHYFTMELVKGKTLQALARNGELTPEASAQVIAKVARAIDYAHERHIIHRDLKPSNVLVDEHGEPHVMDFGLAKDLSDVSGLTLTGVAMGSPPYMPPEQARGEFREVDEISDVYGLGATLYECLVGKPPFGGKSLYDVIAKVLVEDPPAPRSVRPEVPYDVETVCLKALEKEKWRRYPSAASMAEDLERTVQGLSIRAVRQGVTTRVARMIRRHQFQLFSLLIPMIVMGAVFAYVFGGRETPAGADATGAHRYEVVAGPLTKTAEHLENNEDAALAAVLRTRPKRLPSWSAVESGLAPYLNAEHRKLRRTFETEYEAAQAKGAKPSSSADPGRLASILWEAIREPKIDHAALGALVTGWLSQDPALAELTRRTTLAVRGSWSRKAEPYREIFAGKRPLTVLDRAILTGAAQAIYGADALAKAQQALTPAGSAQRTVRLAGAPPAPRLSRLEQAVVATDRPTGWVFPEVRVPGVAPRGKAPRPLLRGLLRPTADHRLTPTIPLRSADGERVVVGWLRFVYLLRDADGGVLARARLPGLAEGIEHLPAGGYRVRIWNAGTTTWVYVRVQAGRLEIREPDGSPIGSPALQAADADGLPDQLEREARSLFPEFEDVIDIYRITKSSGETDHGWQQALHRRVIVRPQPGSRLDLGFLQEDPDRTPRAPPYGHLTGPWAPVVTDKAELELRRVAAVTEGHKVQKVLQPGDLLHRFEVRRGSVGVQKAWAVILRQAEGKSERFPFKYSPVRRLATAEVERVIDASADHLARHTDPNPWVHAFRAAALALQIEAETEGADALGPERDRAAQAAVRSPHLTPFERVSLGCFLDRAGLTAAADAAFTRALRTLVQGGAFLPNWGGYGPLDCGRLIAERVEECLLVSAAPERSRTLARWRNAFAPVLNESGFAARSYQRQGIDLAQVKVPATKPAPPPWPTQARVPEKGVGGMTAIELYRVDNAIKLQNFLALSVLWLLMVSLARYRSYTIRDLARLGVTDAKGRWAMWRERPWVRLRYTWVTYLTLQDRLAFIVLFLIYFGVFAVQDAWLDAVTAQRRARASLMSGNPGEPAALGSLEASFERSPTTELAYTVCWLRAARGQPPHKGALAALESQRSPRAKMLLAEIELAHGSPEAAKTYLASVQDDALALRSAALERRIESPKQAAVDDALANTSLRLTLARWAKVERPLLSPAPTPADRDQVLLEAGAWEGRIPALAIRNLFQPFPGRVDASITAFERHVPWKLNFSRTGNRFFFLVPLAIVLLLASLIIPAGHRYEPLASDIERPPFVKRLLRLAFPGVPQFLRGKPLRGVLLLLPFGYMGHTLFNVRAGFDSTFLTRDSLELSLGARNIASLTAEALSAVPEIQAKHYIELAWLLLVLYTIHWIDLAITQRKQMVDVRERPEREEPSRFIIPFDDSASGLPSPPPESEEREGAPGPFDRTERDL